MDIVVEPLAPSTAASKNPDGPDGAGLEPQSEGRRPANPECGGNGTRLKVDGSVVDP